MMQSTYTGTWPTLKEQGEPAICHRQTTRALPRPIPMSVIRKIGRRPPCTRKARGWKDTVQTLAAVLVDSHLQASTPAAIKYMEVVAMPLVFWASTAIPQTIPRQTPCLCQTLLTFGHGHLRAPKSLLIFLNLPPVIPIPKPVIVILDVLNFPLKRPRMLPSR